jgi:hypothetical protein
MGYIGVQNNFIDKNKYGLCSIFNIICNYFHSIPIFRPYPARSGQAGLGIIMGFSFYKYLFLNGTINKKHFGINGLRPDRDKIFVV